MVRYEAGSSHACHYYLFSTPPVSTHLVVPFIRNIEDCPVNPTAPFMGTTQQSLSATFFCFISVPPRLVKTWEGIFVSAAMNGRVARREIAEGVILHLYRMSSGVQVLLVCAQRSVWGSLLSVPPSLPCLALSETCRAWTRYSYISLVGSRQARQISGAGG